MSKKNRKFNLGIVAITLAIIALLGISVYFIKDKITYPDNQKITTNIVKNNKIYNLRDYVIVDTFTEGTETKIKNIIVLSSDEKNNIVGNLFPGELQVGVDGEYDRLNNIVNIKNISKLKSILKKNFNIEMNEYSIIFTSGKNEAVEYQTLFSELLANTEEDCKTKINELLVDNNKISNKKLKTFYNTYHGKAIIIEPIIYETISINNVLNANIRATVDMTNYKDYVFLVCDKSVLDKNKIVKSLKNEYDNKKVNINTEEDDDDDNTYNGRNNTYNGGNNTGGRYNGTTGGTGGNVTTVPTNPVQQEPVPTNPVQQEPVQPNPVQPDLVQPSPEPQDPNNGKDISSGEMKR